MVPPSTDEILPPDWRKYYPPDGSWPYYYNVRTNQTNWDPPRMAPSPPCYPAEHRHEHDRSSTTTAASTAAVPSIPNSPNPYHDNQTSWYPPRMAPSLPFHPAEHQHEHDRSSTTPTMASCPSLHYPPADGSRDVDVGIVKPGISCDPWGDAERRMSHDQWRNAEGTMNYDPWVNAERRTLSQATKANHHRNTHDRQHPLDRHSSYSNGHHDRHQQEELGRDGSGRGRHHAHDKREVNVLDFEGVSEDDQEGRDDHDRSPRRGGGGRDRSRSPRRNDRGRIDRSCSPRPFYTNYDDRDRSQRDDRRDDHPPQDEHETDDGGRTPPYEDWSLLTRTNIDILSRIQDR
ncbi:hypothetical protein HDV00_007482 [Rhizophlyctis rosea]|nr:hypothetical protein HDV00_007482 [Rhizophlyctis rosea]